MCRGLSSHPAVTGRKMHRGWPLLLLVLRAVQRGSPTAVDDGCPVDSTGLAASVGPDDGAPWAGKLYRCRSARAGGGDDDVPPCTCNTEPCELKPCVRKCCGLGLAYDGSEQCSVVDGYTKTLGDLPVPKFDNRSRTSDAVHETDQFRMVYGEQTCRPVRLDGGFHVSETGWLQRDESGLAVAPPGQFCVERFSALGFRVSAVACAPDPEVGHELCDTRPGINDQISDWPVTSYTMVGMMVSLACLFSTVLVYALVEDLRSSHGKYVLCHVSMLFVGYACGTVAKLTYTMVANVWCIVYAYIMQFSFLASFFWLNVMCFDLWLAFSRFRPPSRNLKEHEAKMFSFYSIYVWGCTSLISLVTFSMELFPNILFSAIIRPGFGKRRCWFCSNSGAWLYFFGPYATLLFVNLLMFLYTAIKVVKQMRDANILNGSESRRNMDQEKHRFMLYLRLFITMGINYSTDLYLVIVLNAADSTFVNYVTTILIASPGVYTFLIFVCNNRVLTSLTKNLRLVVEPTNIPTKSTKSTKSTKCTVSVINTDNDLV